MMALSMYEHQVSVLLHMYREEDGGGTSTIGEIRHLVASETLAAQLMSALADKGKVRRGQSLVGDYHLTLDGKADAQNALDRQRDRRHRRTQCRNRLLAWIDNCGTVGDLVDPGGFHDVLDGLAFSTDEINDTLRFLIEKGLVRGAQRTASGEYSSVAITGEGSECVDSAESVNAYLDETRSRSNTQGTTFHVEGMGHTFATATADGAQATAHVTNNFTIEGARLFGRAVEAAADDLQLNSEARDALATISETSDPTLARRAAFTLHNFVLAAGAGTVGQVLGMYGADLLGIM